MYILIPLLAAFEGVPGDRKSGSNIHAILRFTRTSLFMGPNALISRLRMLIPDVENYISVCGLRNYDCWPDGRFVGFITLLQSCPPLPLTLSYAMVPLSSEGSGMYTFCGMMVGANYLMKVVSFKAPASLLVLLTNVHLVESKKANE